MTRVDLKVVLLGREYGGKTSLLERYVHDRFKGVNFYQNTIGAAFAAKKVESHGKQFVIGIWDTAGSERYEAMSRIYYRGAKAAIVCFDLTDRESWYKAKFWVNELRKYEEHCKIYLCGTKRDLVLDEPERRQADFDTINTFSKGIQSKFMETSSLTGENVCELFQVIADDFMSDPANIQQVEETIRLDSGEKRLNCCGGS